VAKILLKKDLMSYSAKFMVRKGQSGSDYAVMPLEGLWWSDDMASFVADDRSKWQWTMMIHQPSFVDESVLRDALAEVKKARQSSGSTISSRHAAPSPAGTMKSI